MSDNIDTLLDDISNGTALCVGDGSYFEHRDICACDGLYAPEMAVNGEKGVATYKAWRKILIHIAEN